MLVLFFGCYRNFLSVDDIKHVVSQPYEALLFMSWFVGTLCLTFKEVCYVVVSYVCEWVNVNFTFYLKSYVAAVTYGAAIAVFSFLNT